MPLRSNFNKASFFGGAVIPATQNPVYVLEYAGVTHLDPIALHNLNSRSKKLKFNLNSVNILILQKIPEGTKISKSKIKLPSEEIAAFCKKNHIRKLSLFGSVLRVDFGPASDIDFLIEFENDKVPGLIGLSRMERELFAIPNGRKIDLRTPQDLSKYSDMMYWRMLRSNMQHDLIRLRHMA